MNHDLVNAGFEVGSSIAMSFHIHAIFRDRKVRGMSPVPIAFYAFWGAWNLIYYSSLGHDYSWAAGISVFILNSIHLASMIYFIRKEKREIAQGIAPPDDE